MIEMLLVTAKEFLQALEELKQELRLPAAKGQFLPPYWHQFLDGLALYRELGFLAENELRIPDILVPTGELEDFIEVKGIWSSAPTFAAIASLNLFPDEPDISYFGYMVIRSLLNVERTLAGGQLRYESRLSAGGRLVRTVTLLGLVKVGSYPAGRQLPLVKSPTSFDIQSYWQEIFENCVWSDEQSQLNADRLVRADLKLDGGYARVVDEARRARSSHLLDRGANLFELRFDSENTESILTEIRSSPEEAASDLKRLISKEEIVEVGSIAAYRIRKTRGRRNGIRKSSQLLRCGQAVPSEAAVSQYLNFQIEMSKVGSGRCRAERAFAIIRFLSGRSDQEVSETFVARSVESIPNNINQIYLLRDGSLIVAPAFVPLGARQISSAWKHLVRPSGDRVYLPVPVQLRTVLQRAAKEKVPASRSVKLFPLNKGAVVERSKARFFDDTKERRIGGVTWLQLQTCVPRWLSNSELGRHMASLILGIQIGGTSTSQNYYLNRRVSDLAENYQTALESYLEYLGVGHA